MPKAKILFRALLSALLLTAAATGAATLEITGPPGASVIINGVDMGVLPLDAPLELETGHYQVESTLQGYISFSQLVRLEREEASLHLQVRLDRLSKGTAWRSNILFAGLGQMYTGQKARGWIYIAAEAGGLITALVAEGKRSNHSKEYQQIMYDYDRAINQFEVQTLREAADAEYAQMEDASKMRDTGLLVAVGAIAVSIVDVLITFPNVAAGPGPVPPVTGYLDDDTGRVPDFTSLHAGVRLTF